MLSSFMKKTPYISLVALLLSAVPVFAFAAADNLTLLGQPITCSGADCDFCNLLELANVVMKFTVYISILLAAIGFTYVGWTLVTMVGNVGKIDKAKQVATSVVIGFVFVLAAWLIVATISQALLESGKLPWEDIVCEDFVSSPDDDGGVVPGDDEDDPDEDEPLCTASYCPNCPSCVNVDPTIPAKSPGAGCDMGDLSRIADDKKPQEGSYDPSRCLITPNVNGKLMQINMTFNGDWRVNEMWPPTLDHSNSCHDRGTCVDARPIDISPESVAAFCKAAEDAGFRPEWEERDSGGRFDQIRIEMGRIGAGCALRNWNYPPHFSLY